MTTAGLLAIAGLYAFVLAVVGLVISSMRQTSSLRIAIAQVEGRLGEVRGQLGEVRGQMEALRSDVQAGFALVRQEMATTAAGLAGEMSELRERLAKIGS
ncbi:MAG: hypothetical protein M3N52_00800 [Actinomycetota bacterium]|nr:hypothetical protein [Actinomycetota bacterium]